MSRRTLAALAVILLFSAQPRAEEPGLLLPGEEAHLKNIRQLTFGGENAEAYFNPEGTELILQAHHEEGACDQIYIMDIATGDTRMVSTGDGVTTCSFFIPGTDEFIYASTHGADASCPPAPDPTMGYVWPLHEGYDIFVGSTKDGKIKRQLTATPGYDAEAGVSPDGKEIVFCSIRSGDLELYKMNVDGSNLTRLTRTLGYDGGPFFSPKGTYIVYRAHHPRTPEEVEKVRYHNENEVVSPMRLEIWMMKASGEEQRQVTQLDAASFGPYMHPNEEQIIFSTNYSPEGTQMHGKPNFDLYLINKDGTGLERVTQYEDFDGFPMFSPDGKYLVFASNRNADKKGDTNLFLAEWVK
ncbi:hypothetical protein KQI63_12245 [bacterium]|nr:hypothetical protein [bacterium]